MLRFFIFSFLTTIASLANAQIGYQVAVVDQATGEPKANTAVSITVTITDNAGSVIESSSQSATTNDFGVISLQIGNESTFANTDWTKLPLWISATVDGVSLGKTQILTVPVAEHAKHTGELTPEILAGTWRHSTAGDTITITFTSDGAFTWVYSEKGYTQTARGTYEIDGNFVITSGDGVDSYHYSPVTKTLTCIDGGGRYTR